jgi:hypothetical protein
MLAGEHPRRQRQEQRPQPGRAYLGPELHPRLRPLGMRRGLKQDRGGCSGRIFDDRRDHLLTRYG